MRRFLASRENCRRALYKVETGIIVDNSSADTPLRVMAVTKKGLLTYQQPKLPSYLQELLPVPSETDQPQTAASAKPGI